MGNPATANGSAAYGKKGEMDGAEMNGNAAGAEVADKGGASDRKGPNDDEAGAGNEGGDPEQRSDPDKEQDRASNNKP